MKLGARPSLRSMLHDVLAAIDLPFSLICVLRPHLKRKSKLFPFGNSCYVAAQDGALVIDRGGINNKVFNYLRKGYCGQSAEVTNLTVEILVSGRRPKGEIFQMRINVSIDGRPEIGTDHQSLE